MMKYFKGTKLPALVFFGPWIFYFAVIWSQAIQIRPDGWYAAYIPHWGDGIAHLSYMAAFAYRDMFPMEHPLFLGHPFTYSFVADMIGGLLTRLGMPLWSAYNWWGFALSVTGIAAMFIFLKRVTQSSWMAASGGYLFLFSGGLGFRYLISEWLQPETALKPDYFFVLLTQRPDTHIAWLNTIVGELIPQRAMLLAIPVGIWLLLTWYRWLLERKPMGLGRLLMSGILFGFMPIIHPHTAMFVGSSGLLWGLYYVYRSLPLNRNQIIAIAVTVLPALLLAATLTVQFLSASVNHGFFTWHPGWLARSKQVSWLLFWWDNWGLFLPLAFIGSSWFLSKRQQLVILPAWIWFGLTNLFLFQPYDWDNSKLLTWVYLLFTIPVLSTLKLLWKKNQITKLLVALVFILMSLSGAVDATKMLDTRTHALQIVDTDELKLAEQVRQYTPTDAVFLTSTTHRNWVPILTGRQILCGYLGWMWTYGISADQRVEEIKAMYAGSAASAELLTQYGVDYVVIGPEERHEFAINEAYFARNFKVFLENETTTVYTVH